MEELILSSLMPMVTRLIRNVCYDAGTPFLYHFVFSILILILGLIILVPVIGIAWLLLSKIRNKYKKSDK